MKNVYTPNDYKELESDSKMIQAAVDEAAKHGAAVVIPRLNERTGECLWLLDESIKLRSGVVVTLDNCHVRLADGTYISFFENSVADDFGVWWKKKDREYDIKLCGIGNAVLDGGVPNGLFESDFNLYDDQGNYLGKRNYLGFKGASINRGVKFRNVERFSVSGIHFINQRYWAMSFEFCSFGHISDITFEAFANVPNQDGIDIRVGCNNILIENISGYTGDDMIALTNFGVNEDYDMDPDIHDIIVKNIRSYESSSCDMIRILNRGGFKIYNIEISNVIDLTPVGGEKRPLAAVRIGDLNNYPARLNEPGETRNITVRDVITRARFGVYIANSITDSVIDNVMLVGDAGIGMYFNGCKIRNLFVERLAYSSTAEAPASDVGYKHLHHKVYIDALSAVRFDNSEAQNLFFDKVVCGKGLRYFFKSNSEIDVNLARGVCADGGELPESVGVNFL